MKEKKLTGELRTLLEFDGPRGVTLSHAERKELLATITALEGERNAAHNEIATGFDVIFPYVVEANDAEGNPLSLADKIQILGSSWDTMATERGKAAESFRSRLVAAVREKQDSIRAQLGHEANHEMLDRIIGLGEALEIIEQFPTSEGAS